MINCSFEKFVDDFQIYIECKPSDINIVINPILQDILAVQNWSLENSFKLNADKTQAIILALLIIFVIPQKISIHPIFSSKTNFSSSVINLWVYPSINSHLKKLFLFSTLVLKLVKKNSKNEVALIYNTGKNKKPKQNMHS